jgi:hypothetical protein
MPATRKAHRSSTDTLALVLGLTVPVCASVFILGVLVWRFTQTQAVGETLPTLAPTLNSVAAINVATVTPEAPTLTPPVSSTPLSAAPIATPSATATLVPTTASPTATGPTGATPTATLTAAETPSPTSTEAASATPTATATTATASEPWSFVATRAFYSTEDESFRVFGEVINNTGSVQTVTDITGAFYNAQGQVIANSDNIAAAWPQSLIGPGLRMPFDLFVTGIQSADRFELTVTATQSPLTLRGDLTAADVSQATEGANYCVRGNAQNPGAALQGPLTVVAVLFDAQEKVVNYAFRPYAPAALPAGGSLAFKVCAGTPNDNVARWEVRLVAR